ncbi:hypothetical protein AFL22_06450 [Pantoea sp. CFSAN033090]|nr:hypothetical protein AFL22_06450 [Pantoea sp. CFSAN033090]
MHAGCVHSCNTARAWRVVPVSDQIKIKCYAIVRVFPALPVHVVYSMAVCMNYNHPWYPVYNGYFFTGVSTDNNSYAGKYDG